MFFPPERWRAEHEGRGFLNLFAAWRIGSRASVPGAFEVHLLEHSPS
jgi:hypothetical protein